MSTQHLLFLAIVFAVVFGLAATALLIFAPGAISKRLGAFMAPPEDGVTHVGGWIERVARVAQPWRNSVR